MLRFDLSKKLGETELLPLLHFKGQIQLTGICTLFGDSGAGKTSLVRALAGLDDDFSGSVCFKSNSWQGEKHFVRTEKRKIGIVFQEPRLFPHLDVLANLQLAGKKADAPLYTIKQLAEILGFSDLLHKRSRQLSGGQKQRIAIARAILRAPELLIMDEPLASLDKPSRLELLPFIKKLGEQIPTLYITHNMQELFYLSRQMLLIDRGRVEAIGDPNLLFLDARLSLVKHAHSGLLIEVNKITWQPMFAMASGRIDGQAILLTGYQEREEKALPDKLQIKVASKDIIIATRPIKHSSLQNCLQVTILQIEPLVAGVALLTLTTGKQKLLAKITRKSLIELKLQPNLVVFAYIKAMSIVGEAE
ncbi:MAG TPA: ATP-binding cassette domain-containing protein [Psychromonas sp.]